MTRILDRKRISGETEMTGTASGNRQGPSRSASFAASLLLEMLGSVLTRGQRRVLAAADLMVPLLKLLAVALYFLVSVGAER